MKRPPIGAILSLAAIGLLAGQPLSLADQVANFTPVRVRSVQGSQAQVSPASTQEQHVFVRVQTNAAASASNKASETSNRDDSSRAHKCSSESIQLARQMLSHELHQIHEYLPTWFNDLDEDELMEEQKESLSSVIMAGLASKLLTSEGQPLLELESSYLRPMANASSLSLGLMRRNTDRCYLDKDNYKYSYVTRLALGPLEHHLDVVYHFPKDLQLSQPTSWRYSQVRLQIPRMIYEVTLRQIADYKLDGSLGESARRRADGIEQAACPLEVLDITHLASPASQGQEGAAKQGQISVTGWGLPATNQTALQLERLFNDYTRPTVSSRLRQLLKFYLSSKTLPLSS